VQKHGNLWKGQQNKIKKTKKQKHTCQWTLTRTENSDACLKQTLDQVSMKQKTSTGSRGNWTTMTNVS
jgi:hypothetical protein